MIALDAPVQIRHTFPTPPETTTIRRLVADGRVTFTTGTHAASARKGNRALLRHYHATLCEHDRNGFAAGGFWVVAKADYLAMTGQTADDVAALLPDCPDAEGYVPPAPEAVRVAAKRKPEKRKAGGRRKR